MSQALPRKLQSAISWSRFSRSSLQRNQPGAAEVGVHDDAGRVVGRRAGSGAPSTRTYWNPWTVWRGSNDVARPAGGDDPVDLAEPLAAELEVRRW